jgi:prefoldin subunit 5
MDIQVLLWLAGVGLLLIGGLLMLIGHFLKELHKDFKGLKDAVVGVITKLAVSEEKGRAGYKLLDQRIEDLERRTEKVEGDIEKIEDRITN